MGTMTTTYSRLTRQAEYQNEELFITLNYQVDEDSKELISIDGSVNKGESREYAGRFNGRPDGGEMSYDTSGVKRADMPRLYNALTDIEQQIASEFTPVTTKK